MNKYVSPIAEKIEFSAVSIILTSEEIPAETTAPSGGRPQPGDGNYDASGASNTPV